MVYAGLPNNYDSFSALFESLLIRGATKLNVDNDCLSDSISSGKPRLADEFLMTLMGLRFVPLQFDLEYRCKVSASRMPRDFTCSVRVMHTQQK